jgi:hypothetical protein
LRTSEKGTERGHLSVDGAEDAELTEADVKGRAGELGLSILPVLLDDDDVYSSGECGRVDLLEGESER